MTRCIGCARSCGVFLTRRFRWKQDQRVLKLFVSAMTGTETKTFCPPLRLGVSSSDRESVRRVTKLVISTWFFVICSLRNLLFRLCKRKMPGFCVVLYYHAVPEAYRARFEEQMDTLIRFSEPIPADRKLSVPSGRR